MPHHERIESVSLQRVGNRGAPATAQARSSVIETAMTMMRRHDAELIRPARVLTECTRGVIDSSDVVSHRLARRTAR